MPTKHIDENVWRKVEKETMKAIFELKKPIKETTMLKWLIIKGLEEMKAEDYKKMERN